MPVITLITNFSKNFFTSKLQSELIELMSEVLKKPQEVVFLHLLPENLCFRGGNPTNDEERIVILYVKDIGSLGAERNGAHSAAITQFLLSKLEGLKAEGLIIHFQSVQSHEVGRLGTTVEALMDKDPNLAKIVFGDH